MYAIAAVTSDWGIGCDGKLLVNDPHDMANFKALTYGCTVVMGRKTFESIGHPLEGRRNVVITSQDGYALSHPGIECASNIDQMLEMVVDDQPYVWVIGGEMLYRSLVPFCEYMVITHYARLDKADAYFPVPDWRMWEIEYVGPMDQETKRYIVVYAKRWSHESVLQRAAAALAALAEEARG